MRVSRFTASSVALGPPAAAVRMVPSSAATAAVSAHGRTYIVYSANLQGHARQQHTSYIDKAQHSIRHCRRECWCTWRSNPSTLHNAASSLCLSCRAQAGPSTSWVVRSCSLTACPARSHVRWFAQRAAAARRSSPRAANTSRGWQRSPRLPSCSPPRIRPPPKPHHVLSLVCNPITYRLCASSSTERGGSSHSPSSKTLPPPQLNGPNHLGLCVPGGQQGSSLQPRSTKPAARLRWSASAPPGPQVPFARRRCRQPAGTHLPIIFLIENNTPIEIGAGV